MGKYKCKKTFLLTATAVVLLLLWTSGVFNIVVGAVRLEHNKNSMVCYKSTKETDYYITKTSNIEEIIKIYMESNGFEFVDQLGAGFVFKNGGKEIIIVASQFTKRYRRWEIPKDI